MNEVEYDKLLNIQTIEEQKGFNDSVHYHRYEATPYNHLAILTCNYEITSSHKVIDVGCGKGRLNLYLHHHYQIPVTGIEQNEGFIRKAEENSQSYMKKHTNSSSEKIQFFHGLAEAYPIQSDDNCFYFFNPFSVQIFRSFVQKILLSWEMNSRKIDVILYYPDDEYVYFLQTSTPLKFVKEIELPRYKKDIRERFIIFTID
ncbi:class I SAM-dependent methyltransferase [Bacillus alkalisoli]|uniref:class I SAM-dependent methyltransferase n=1 Tax=Bacillus alkalisoli TaxID=2011008 RepID=UPI000C248B02|nr:class I SAM-dependent methyltransferase [Bacillus alkalisoli]